MAPVKPHHDRERIPDRETLIRRINANEHLVPDENRRCMRVSSKAFTASSGQDGGMSVDVLGLMRAANVDAHRFVTLPPFTGAAQFIAGAARASGLSTAPHPIDCNPYHAEVWRLVVDGTGTRGAPFTKAQQKALRRACTWFVRIPDAEV